MNHPMSQPTSSAERTQHASLSYTPLVSLESVSFGYADAPLLFSSLTLDIYPREKLIITGASGSGKSSLVSLILGLISPVQGRIITSPALRVAAVFQENRLATHMSVSANLRYPAGIDRLSMRPEFLHKARTLLAQLGLDDVLARPVHELSGGMQRRVSIARALLVDADLYVFDEALKALDAENEARTLECICSITHDKSVIWATHHISEADAFCGARILSTDIFHNSYS